MPFILPTGPNTALTPHPTPQPGARRGGMRPYLACYAGSCVARKLVRLGSNPVLRSGFITDNGNVILDVHGMSILTTGQQA